jgi:ribosomal protein S18 acetylase RimI-like enzyme
MMSTGKITLRPVLDSDEEFLLALYGSTREEELARVAWPREHKEAFVRMQWQAQKQHYAHEHPRADHTIISVDEVPVGRLYLDRSGQEFHILDITVLPQYRNRGTGSFLIAQIMAEANEAGKPVTIFVETFNPSLRLFERLEFCKAEETGFHFLMRWPREQVLSVNPGQ